MRTIKIKQVIKQISDVDECVLLMDGYSIEKRDGLWYILKEDGELLSDIGFWEVIKLSDEFVVNIEGTWQCLSNQGEILNDFVYVETVIDAASFAQEMRGCFQSSNTIIPIQLNEHSTVFIKEDGSPVCETGIIKYWKLVDDDSDSRYVVRYGWKRNRLYLIDSTGTEGDPGFGLIIDSPRSWGDEGDCSFIKYYPSGLFLIESHNKYGFARIMREGIPYQYDSVEEVNDSLLLVKVNNLYGLLDIYGRELTPVKYGWIDIHELRTFSNAVVRDFHLLSRGYSLKEDDYGVFRMAVLDITGKEIIPSVSYKCISRFRYEQELEHPLFVVSSSCWKMTVPDEYHEDPEIDCYQGEMLSSHQWGIVNHMIGEVVPQDYDMFSILSNEDEIFILCHHDHFSILYDSNGRIVLGSIAGISINNGCFVLSWNSRSFSVLNKDLQPLMKESEPPFHIEKGSFVCDPSHKSCSTIFDDPPDCLYDMTEVVLPESAFLNRGDFLKMMDQLG